MTSRIAYKLPRPVVHSSNDFAPQGTFVNIWKPFWRSPWKAGAPGI